MNEKEAMLRRLMIVLRILMYIIMFIIWGLHGIVLAICLEWCTKRFKRIVQSETGAKKEADTKS